MVTVDDRHKHILEMVKHIRTNLHFDDFTITVEPFANPYRAVAQNTLTVHVDMELCVIQEGDTIRNYFENNHEEWEPHNNPDAAIAIPENDE